jgi:signal transduction histidine kinase
MGHTHRVPSGKTLRQPSKRVAKDQLQVLNQETALGFLVDYSKKLLDCRTLDDIFELALKTSKERLHTRISSIFLFSKEGKLERRFLLGLSCAFPQEVYERGQGLVGRTAGTSERFGEPHLSKSLATDDRIQGDPVVMGYVAAYNQAVFAEHGFEEKAASAIAIPLNGHHRTFGVLRMVNKLDPETGTVSGRPFNQVDRDWLSMLTRLTANAVVNVKRQNRLSMLGSLQLGAEDTGKGFLDRVAKILTSDSSMYSACLIHALDRSNDELEILGHSSNFRRLKGFEGRQDVRVKVGDGVCGKVFQSGRNKIVRDLRKNADGFKFPEWIEFNGFVSLICLTIKNHLGGPDFGTLQLFTKCDYTFDADDIQYLEGVAQRISVVLRTLQEKKDLQRINRLAEKINAQNRVEDILQICVKEMPGLLIFDRALAVMSLPGSSTMQVTATSDDLNVGDWLDAALASSVFQKPKVRAFNSIRPGRVPEPIQGLLPDVESLVILPVGGASTSFRCAVLLVNARSGSPRGRLKAFRQSLSQIIATQMSSSLRKIELRIESERQATLQNLLREISSTDPGGPKAILSMALRQLVKTLGVDAALLGLLSNASEGFEPIVTHGLCEADILDAAQSATQMLEDGFHHASEGNIFQGLFGTMRQVCLPITSQEQTMGALVLRSERTGAFEEAARHFTETFLSGIAGKLQNNSLFRAALALGTMRFDEMKEERICQILAEKTSEMMSTPVTCVWLRRRVGDLETLVLEGVHGVEIENRSSFAMERSKGGLSWQLIAEVESFSAASSESCSTAPAHKFYEDIQASGVGFRHPHFARQNGLKSMISVPLVLDGKVLGVINTYARRYCEFYDRSVYLLQNLALSGSMALGNAELNERLSRIMEEVLNKAQLANPGIVALSFSHDIRLTMNHVNALLTSLVALIPRRTQEEEPGKSVIAAVTSSTDYLSDLFHSLVRYAAGKPLRYVPTSLIDVIKYVQYICDVRLRARKIATKVECGDIWIESDRNQLEQVFLNLFNNSIYAISKKMSKGGQIEITARLLDESFVEIQFKDNGIGMSSEERKEAFKLFFTTKGDEGTGFGLPICRKIVEDNHHGEIWIDPKRLDGTVIYIKLPRQQKGTFKEKVQ